MKIIYRTVLALFIFAFLVGCVTGGRYAIPEYEDNVRIDLGTHLHWQWDNKLSREVYQDVVDAGFNFSTLVLYSIDSLLEAMDYCEEAGLKVLVRDPYGFQVNGDDADFERYYPSYRDHPAYFGNDLWDEPKLAQFTMVKSLYDAYKAVAPDKLGFINIVCSPALAEPYPWHVNTYMNTVNPDLLSLDYYPFNANMNPDEVTVAGSYFSNLAVIAQNAKERGVPTHLYILSVAHINQSIDGVYPQPTEASLRWQIACGLAFGISSFTYYTYWTPTPGGGWVYDNAAIARDGTKTEIYDFAKTVNHEVLAWDHVYLRYKWQGTAKISGSRGEFNFMFLNYFDESYVDPNGIDGIKNIVSSEDMLCGVFEDADGNKGYMLTNATNPYGQKPASVTVTFDNAYRGVQIYEKGAPRVASLSGNGSVTISLEPGEGKFFIPLERGK